jgi:hypothetical protein
MNTYILTQITLTLDFQSGTITIIATLTSLLPTLVRRFAGRILSMRSLLDCQATQARLVTPKHPQPRVNLIDVAATPSILRSYVCATCRETRILQLRLRYLSGNTNPVLAALVRDCRGRVAIQKAGD